MNERARRISVCSILTAQLLVSLAGPAFAQQDDSSLDALWSDSSDSSKGQAANKNSQARKNPTSIDTSPNFKVTTGGATDSGTGSSSSAVDFSKTAEDTEVSTPASGTSSPLCSVDSFKGSDFVKSGGWPGVGPFNTTTRVPNELKDAQDNHLRLKVDNQKVTEAELCLVKQPNAGSNFINLQMTTDYFLEALGVKPSKISDFNKELEKSRAEVVKEDVRPLNLPAGKYQVLIAAPTDEDLSSLPQDKKDKIALVIKVSSRDASIETIKEHPTDVSDTSDTQPVQQPPVRVAAAAPVRTAPPVKAPVRTTAPAVKTTPVATPPAAASSDPLKAQFADLLKNWQTIKKGAVRSRSTGELSEILSGEALKKQTGAINYLMSQHKYYEMTSKGVIVNKIQELTPGKKYACYAQVKEYRRFIDDTTGKVLKEGDDTYNVNYTIEKVGDKFFISDSAVINNLPSAPPKTR
ncbi:MAG: DUF4101 domain-containing protein [Candidatus Melainabacteria bacterium]|jgi:hypothetical protein|nr:DUF4101 domain-containing protein [Candidatus Melainabacteria bacterium]